MAPLAFLLMLLVLKYKFTLRLKVFAKSEFVVLENVGLLMLQLFYYSYYVRFNFTP